jgi:hypothetical protein
MKIVRDENQHNDSERDFDVIHCWREEFDIQELILIYFELRTLLDLKMKNVKRCYLYLNKSKKVEFELQIFLDLLEDETESRKMSRCYNSAWEINC